MDLDKSIRQMTRSADTIAQMVRDTSDEQARWRPDPDSWSVLEVINHLYDEEREDFRVRLDMILHKPDQPWPAIDPKGWVSSRSYNQRSLAESLEDFLAERRSSLAWLKSLKLPDWDAAAETPWGGRLRAGDMFAAWVAHDLLHTRQLVELLWAYTKDQLQPYKVDYAGSW